MLLLGSQEKGWPLGCLSGALLGPRAVLLLFVWSTILAEKKRKKKPLYVQTFFIFSSFYCILSPTFGC